MFEGSVDPAKRDPDPIAWMHVGLTNISVGFRLKRYFIVPVDEPLNLSTFQSEVFLREFLD